MAVAMLQAQHGHRLPLPDDPAVCPPLLARLIARCWAADPRLRPSAGEVVKRLRIVADVEAGRMGLSQGDQAGGHGQGLGLGSDPAL